MQSFDECLTFKAVALALGLEELSLIDRMALSAERERRKLVFSVGGHKILQSWDFFESRKYEFFFVQDGEFLTLEHLNKNKVFIAYEKERSGFNTNTQREIHNVYAYKPEA